MKLDIEKLVWNLKLKDWYFQQEVMRLLGMPLNQRMRIHRIRNKFTWLELCNKPIYLRQDVNKYAEGLIKKGGLTYYDYFLRKANIRTWDISLKEYHPTCLVEAGYYIEQFYPLTREQLKPYNVTPKILYNYLSLSRPTLHFNATGTGYPIIEAKEVYGFYFYNIKHLQNRDREDFTEFIDTLLRLESFNLAQYILEQYPRPQLLNVMRAC